MNNKSNFMLAFAGSRISIQFRSVRANQTGFEKYNSGLDV
jgi:hypothetical protein